MTMNARRTALSLMALTIVGAAAWVLHGTLRGISVDELIAALRGTPIDRLALAAVATAMSFAALGWYECFAARVVAPGRVRDRDAMFIGMVSHAVANTLGFHALTGTALRVRLFGRLGLGVADVARLITIVGVCVGLGSITMLAVALAFAPDAFAGGRAAGAACLLVLLAALAFFPALANRLRRRHAGVPTLDRRAVVAPIAMGIVEAGAAVAAFYVLLPADVRPGFALVAAVFIGAMLLGVMSHAPGGVGVFEATVLTAFPPTSHAHVLAGLLLYRLFYNLLPFALAVLALSIHELRARRARTCTGADAATHQFDGG